VAYPGFQHGGVEAPKGVEWGKGVPLPSGEGSWEGLCPPLVFLVENTVF